MEAVVQKIKNFKSKKALIVGDVMIDAYLWGDVSRISPEAPVPVVDISNSENRMGGAANVALNIQSLGAEAIICSVIGEDESGQRFMDLMKDGDFGREGLVLSADRRTTTKTRIISSGQHMLRVDQENKHNISSQEEDKLIQSIQSLIASKKPDVIILEDYNKGVLTPKVIEKVIDMANANEIPTTVDPKKDNFFAYKNCSLFKPNLKELKEGTKVEINPAHEDEVLEAMKILESELQNKASLVTLSEYGVIIKKDQEVHSLPAEKRKILDVSGAGDTVISVASLCLASGMDMRSLAFVSNLAGGMVCEYVGVVPINVENLLAEVQLKMK